MTRTTPLRRITLHFTQIFFTEARTFMESSRNESTGASRARTACRSENRLAPHPENSARAAGANPTQKGRAYVTAGEAPVNSAFKAG